MTLRKLSVCGWGGKGERQILNPCWSEYLSWRYIYLADLMRNKRVVSVRWTRGDGRATARKLYNPASKAHVITGDDRDDTEWSGRCVGSLSPLE